MKKTRNTFWRILGAVGIYLLVFGAVVFALFLYRDLKNQPPADTSTADTSPADTSTVDTSTVESTITESTVPPNEADEDLPYTVVGVFTVKGLPKDYSRPTGELLTQMEFPFYLPEVYSLRSKTVQTYTIEGGEADSERYVTETIATVDRLAIETYMGYFLFDKGDKVLLCDGDGKPVFEYSPDEYSPAYQRDTDGRPLFVGVADGAETYYTVGENSFVASDFDPENDSRGLRFDYPESYGKAEDAKIAISNERGAIYGVGADGAELFAHHTTYYNKHGRYVDEYYLPPLTYGIESVGYYHFDSGYTRVRRQVIDHYNYFGLGQTKVVSEEEILVSDSGKVFTLPTGYSLAGYSEGMLLLEKDGAYGFVNLVGEWIAQPIFTSATPFIGGFATLTTDEGKVGMINALGEVIFPFVYRSISINSDGVIAVYNDTYGWEIYKVNEQ